MLAAVNRACHTLIIAAAVAVVALITACATAPSAGPASATEPPPPTALPSPTARPTPAAGGVQVVLATTVLRVGEQRVAFLLAGPKGIVNDPTALVTPVFLGENSELVEHSESVEGSAQSQEARQATFHKWPYGVRGAYATQISFDRPGRWRLDIETAGGSVPTTAQLELDVAREWAIPDIGSVPPTGNNKTLDFVSDLESLTTDWDPDPDLYRMSIDQAIASGRPTVIVFATPAFCTSATCGPQVDAVAELKENYRDSANFIHVELYDNPAEIQGDLSRAELVPMAEEWGFTSIPGWFNESWVFVLDGEGRILQRFEGFATLGEVEAVLTGAMDSAT